VATLKGTGGKGGKRTSERKKKELRGRKEVKDPPSWSAKGDSTSQRPNRSRFGKKGSIGGIYPECKRAKKLYTQIREERSFSQQRWKEYFVPRRRRVLLGERNRSRAMERRKRAGSKKVGDDRTVKGTRHDAKSALDLGSEKDGDGDRGPLTCGQNEGSGAANTMTKELKSREDRTPGSGATNGADLRRKGRTTSPSEETHQDRTSYAQKAKARHREKGRTVATSSRPTLSAPSQTR